MERRAFLAAAGSTVTATLAGCADSVEPSGTEDRPENKQYTYRPANSVTISFEVTPIGADRPVPVEYTCVGQNVSPEMIILDIGSAIESLAYTLTDAEADDILHWSAWGISPDLPALPKAIPQEPVVHLSEVEAADESMDATIFQGENYRGEVGYFGPCPSDGERHRYLYTLHGLDRQLELDPGAPPEAFWNALEGSVVGRTSVTAWFER